MADLKAGFGSLGFENAETYLQSGNVIFASEEPDQYSLENGLEEFVKDTPL